QVVRQELVARQLAEHLAAPPLRVLDVGCGQGTQALRLARLGHDVTGIDSSEALLADLTAAGGTAVHPIRGDVLDMATLCEPGTFDLVLCHGVLMYFPDPEPLLTELARMVVAGGLLALLVRNGDGLAMRPGLLGDWATAWRAFDGSAYGNRIGVTARADRIADLTTALAGHGLRVDTWYGVRVFTDTAPDDAVVPDDATLATLLDCEERAGAADPYRGVAALTHVIARRA
ncbi:MAG TPA: methyltransferase domain-containing protein, partial [Pseudonocardiaceae bacterium]|nr:methyltransferase domain-containing protein [Pseudonocardiaceae bacterium]